MLILSFSSIPSRFGELSDTVESILRQKVKPDRIEVYIPHSYRRFPDWDGTLPSLPEEFNIVRIENDYGPASKVLPAIERYYDDNVDLVYCDDDRVYPANWLSALVKERQRRPHDAIANWGFMVTKRSFLRSPIRLRSVFDLPYRYNKIRDTIHHWRTGEPKRKQERVWRYLRDGGFIDIMEGFAGCMIKPKMYDPDVFNIPEKIWAVDDIWLSGMLAKNGRNIWLNTRDGRVSIKDNDGMDALAFSILDGMNRSEANQYAIEYFREKYGIWRNQ